MRLLKAELIWNPPGIFPQANGAVVAVVDTGISTAGEDTPSHLLAGYDFVNNDNDPTDDNGHGTHVAGTIAQSTNNNVGVCWCCF